MSQKGNKFSYNAPHIKGWNLNDDITKVIDVDESTNTITFKYKKASGNVEVVLKEEDGRVIKTLSDNVTVADKEKTITAPTLETYTIVGESSKKVSYSEDKQVVEFIYSKNLREVEVDLYDVSSGEASKTLIDTKKVGKLRVGEVAKVTAPAVDNMMLAGDSEKLVEIGKGTGAEKVDFNYRSTKEDEIVIEAVEKETGLILQSTSVKADVGTCLKINAPIFDTHKLSQGELGTKTVMAGEKVTFNYDRNTVKVTREAKDKSGNKIELPVGVQRKFEAVRGKDFTAYAPHIPGYVLLDQANNTVKFNKIAEDKTATFIYQSISEVVDEYTVDINVKGVDKLGKELYSYRVNRPKDSGKYRVNAFVLSGYKLDGAKNKEITVEKKDIQVTFEYESLDQLVTIKAVDENDQAIADFTEIKVMSQKGNKFSYNAPHIKGWNLNDDITKVIDVDESTNTITFKYKKASGNVEVVLKEEDGRVIKTLSDNVTVADKEKTITAPDLETYTIVGESSKKVSYSEDKQVVEFIYSKNLREVEVDLYDVSSGEASKTLIDTKKVGKLRVGEVAKVTAPAIDNMMLVGDSEKLVEIGKGTGAEKVDFNYRSTKEDEIVIEAVEKETGLILQSTSVKADVGTSMKINAPIFDTHKLSQGELGTKTVKAGEKVTFKYDKNTVKVTIEAKDKSGNKIELPIGVEGKFDAVRGKDFTAYAPHIPGYVLLDQANNTVKFNKIAKNETATFIYQSISEVVDEYTVDINVKGVDKLGNELYSYRVNRPKGSGKYTVNAFKLSGYKLNGADSKEVKVEKKDDQVTFEYESLDQLVTIKAVDENDQPIKDFTEIKVMSQKGNKFSYNAPHIKGWNLNDNITKVIDVDENKNTITFKYKKASGNVEVVLKEEDGRVIKTLSDNVTVADKEKTITAPDLETYTIVGESSKKVPYSEDKQVVEFIYKKATRKVDLTLYDVSDEDNHKPISTKSLTDEFRVGEVAKVTAPAVDNMMLVGDSVKLVEIGKGAGNQKVRFDYKSTQKDEIVIEAVEKETGLILQSTSVKADVGTSMKINAPIFDTHKLSQGELGTKTVKAGEKVTFNYDKNTVKVTIEAKDNKENEIKLPIGVEGEFEAVRGKDFTAYAPHIPGYVLLDQANNTVKFNKIA